MFYHIIMSDKIYYVNKLKIIIKINYYEYHPITFLS